MSKKFVFAFITAVLAIGLVACEDDVTGPSTEFALSRLSAKFPLGDGASISLAQLERQPSWNPLGFDVEMVTLNRKRVDHVLVKVWFVAEDKGSYQNPTMTYGPYRDVKKIDLQVRFRIRDGLREFVEARPGQRFQPMLTVAIGPYDRVLRVPLGFYITP